MKVPWGDPSLRNPLGAWRQVVKHVEQGVRQELGLGRAERVRARELVNEVIRLADPNAVSSREAVIPGGRDDLARAWIHARLTGLITTKDQCHTFARDLAPAPDMELAHVDQRTGKMRYRHLSEFEAAVSAAATEKFEGRPKPFE